MSKTIKAIRRGVKAAFQPVRPQRFTAAGKLIVCSHCGTDGFVRYGALGATFGGYGVECLHCGHIEYFAQKAKQIDSAV